MWTYNNTSELYHHGILGMKWGHHSSQNNQIHSNNYKKQKELQNKEFKEGNKLINSSSALKKEFGSMKNVDDAEFFELRAREHGLNTDSYWNAKRTADSFYRDNKKSINKGQKIEMKQQPKEKTQTESKEQLKKAVKIGGSVAVGLLAGNIGSIAVVQLTGSISAAAVLAPSMAVIGGMKYYDWVNK